MSSRDNSLFPFFLFAFLMILAMFIPRCGNAQASSLDYVQEVQGFRSDDLVDRLHFRGHEAFYTIGETTSGAAVLEVKANQDFCSWVEVLVNPEVLDKTWVPENFCHYMVAEMVGGQFGEANKRLVALYKSRNGPNPEPFYRGKICSSKAKAGCYHPLVYIKTEAVVSVSEELLLVSDDNDLDNIPNDRDRCPDVAEDPDGFQDEDGCPEMDNDKDGIIDVNDSCPNKFGVLDNFGCPAETTGRLRVSSSAYTEYEIEKDDKIIEDNLIVDETVVKYHTLSSGSYTIFYADRCQQEVAVLPGADVSVTLANHCQANAPREVVVQLDDSETSSWDSIEDLDLDEPTLQTRSAFVVPDFVKWTLDHGHANVGYYGAAWRYGNQHGLFAETGLRFDNDLMVRGWFAWAYDLKMPDYEKSVITGGGALGYGRGSFVYWAGPTYQGQGMARWEQYGGAVLVVNNHLGLSFSVEYHLIEWFSMELGATQAYTFSGPGNRWTFYPTWKFKFGI